MWYCSMPQYVFIFAPVVIIIFLISSFSLSFTVEGVGTLNGTHRIAEAHYNPSIGLGFSDIDM